MHAVNQRQRRELENRIAYLRSTLAALEAQLQGQDVGNTQGSRQAANAPMAVTQGDGPRREVPFPIAAG